MTGTVALIVAAGRGTRMASESPKQYLPLGGVPVLRRAVQAFAPHPAIDAVRCVIDPDDRDAYDAAVDGLDLLQPVAGGATRQDSVRLGLESLVGFAPARVLIHDAARPFVSAAAIAATVAALDATEGAIVAVPVHDSLKRAEAGRVVARVPRDDLWRAQTPQGFRFVPILAAHRAADAGATDDAAVAEAAGLSVAIVTGSEDNLKITTQDDLARAERMLRRRATAVRVGFGFDVHRFGPGDHVVLGGVRIPHEARLVGHSDADAALHALTDALLGTIAEGDIGAHFPPGEPRWHGADSAQFLAYAVRLIADRGGTVEHVDLTILCEQPKIGPYRAAIAARIGEIIGLRPGRIGVKASTTEGLGFTGRREGIAAQAVATVLLPESDR